MKHKYNWYGFLPVIYISCIIICDIFLLIGLIRSIDGNGISIAWFIVILTLINRFGIKWVVSMLRKNVTLTDDIIEVKRPNIEPYPIPLKSVNKFVVSLNAIPNSKGEQLLITADREKGLIVGKGNRMLSAILKLYPNIPVAIKCSSWRLRKNNAILLAKRGCLSEDQLKEVQKRYKLSDGFEKYGQK